MREGFRFEYITIEGLQARMQARMRHHQVMMQHLLDRRCILSQYFLALHSQNESGSVQYATVERNLFRCDRLLPCDSPGPWGTGVPQCVIVHPFIPSPMVVKSGAQMGDSQRCSEAWNAEIGTSALTHTKLAEILFSVHS